MEALQCATLNAATWLGQRDSLGTIEPGKLADLVLLDANPLQDIHNIRKIRAVVFNGRLLDRDRLNQMLAAVETVKSPVTDAPGITRFINPEVAGLPCLIFPPLTLHLC